MSGRLNTRIICAYPEDLDDAVDGKAFRIRILHVGQRSFGLFPIENAECLMLDFWQENLFDVLYGFLTPPFRERRKLLLFPRHYRLLPRLLME
jgi:hypothetical protein